MFEASRSRGFPVLTLVVLALAGAGGWLAYRQLHPAAPVVEAPAPAPVAAPAPAPPSDVVEATPSEVRAGLKSALDAHPGGSLYHLDCAPPGCVATLRIPDPRGADAGWRNQIEAKLKRDGWFLRPPGRVEAFERRQQDELVIPARVLWTFGIRRRPDPLSEEESATLKARIDAQMADSVMQSGAW